MWRPAKSGCGRSYGYRVVRSQIDSERGEFVIDPVILQLRAGNRFPPALSNRFEMQHRVEVAHGISVSHILETDARKSINFFI